MMTIVHTARKRGIAVLDFLSRSVEAHFAAGPAPALAAG
jgi:hypothetical protein